MGAVLSVPGVESLGCHTFKHRVSGRETVAECVSVDFRRVLRSSKFRPAEGASGAVGSKSSVSEWRDTLHALVALYNTCLPNITPELLYSTVCSKGARTLMLVMSPEEALEDVCFRYGARSRLEHITLGESNTVCSSSSVASPFSTAMGVDSDYSVDLSNGANIGGAKGDTGLEAGFSSTTAEGSNPGPGDSKTRIRENDIAEGDRDPPTVAGSSRSSQHPEAIPDGADSRGKDESTEVPKVDGCGSGWHQVEYTEEEEEAAQQVCPNCRKSKYSNVYSDEEESEDSQSEGDTTSDEDEGDSSDDEEQYMVGADEFLEQVHKRKKLRNHNVDKRLGLNLDHIGIENRLFASITFEKRILNSESISYLTVLSVRRRWRGLKLGQFLVQLVIKLAGSLDPLIVLADDDAIEFFEKQGFLHDPMICSKYDELKNEGSWTNCTVMVKLPKLIPEAKELEEMDIKDIENVVEKKVEKWQRHALSLYQEQVSLITQLKKEIIAGREKMKEQQKKIKLLTDELNQQYTNEVRNNSASKLDEVSRNEISLVESQIEKLNLDSVLKEMEQNGNERSSQISNRGDSSNEYIVVTPVSSQTSDKTRTISPPEVSVRDKKFASLEITNKTQEENLEKVIKMFNLSLKNSNMHLFNQIKVVHVHRVLSEETSPIYFTCDDDEEWTPMFYSGSILSVSDIKGIRDRGKFSNFNFTYGDYGIGLYFSRFAEVAVKFSKLNAIVVASVKTGVQTSTLKADSNRRSAGENFDSLWTPGRLSGTLGGSPRRDQAASSSSFSSDTNAGGKCQELLIFDTKRAVPSHVIEYVFK